ncbi:MAG: phosphoethanolamine transferase domain-containing protein, partial [Pseudomonadota bacterium]|nr:phosphoethanolamine transferase domain-containing protein [Pseudomonadota bacterium]
MKKIFHINSITFITLVSLYFSFGLNISFWQLVFSKVSPDNFNTIVFACSLPFFIFIPLFMFFCLLVVPVIGRPLVAILLLLSAAADYAMSNLNVIIDSDMIRNFAETNLREAADFITVKALVCIFVMGIIPAALVLMTDIKFAPFVKETARRILLCLAMLLVLGAFAFTSYKEYASFGRNNSQARKYINTFNYIYAVGRYQQKKLNAERRFVVLDAAPVLNKVPDSRPKLLVLAVGETA